MTDRNIFDLAPVLQLLAEACLTDWGSTYPERKPVKIIVTWRSNADQQAAFNAGLSKCKAGEGKHNCMVDGKPASQAFDFACFTDSGDYIADGTHPYYADFGVIARDNGLDWGGDWTGGFKDYDHCELPTLTT